MHHKRSVALFQNPHMVYVAVPVTIPRQVCNIKYVVVIAVQFWIVA